jgi:colanic acid/amylovoran biosynthesis glycosyltransferase
VNTIVSQALAVGVPVITTRHSGLPEQVMDGHNGYVVDEGDVAALADRILHLEEHRDLLATFGVNGRKHVRQHYNSQDWLERQLEVYRAVAGERCHHTSDSG